MDTLRVVTLSPGGRPIAVADVQDGTTYNLLRDTFKITPGQKRQQLSQQQTRYGGGRVVGESQENTTVGATWLIAGPTADQVNANVETLLALVDYAGADRSFEWIADGATRGAYPEIRGPGQYNPNYSWVEYQGAQVAKVDITWPTAPLARLLPLNIGDPFDVDSLSDYTADSGSKAELAIASGTLNPNGGLTTEKVLFHSSRGHLIGDHEDTLKFTPGATITSFKAGVRLKRTAANTYLDVYVDDNGTNSRLRIDTVTAGVRANLQSTNLVARVSNGTAGWVRGRIEGNVVVAEYFTAAPTPMGAPTLTNTSTLAGGNITAFGAAVTGGRGFSWIPQHASATLDDYASRPYTYRNQTLPQKLTLNGDIPGRGPALCDVEITPSGGTAAPIWALVGWTSRPTTPLASSVVPFGVIEAETATNLSGWTATANGGSRGGNDIRVTTLGAGTFTASWAVDPSTMVADDFTVAEISIEVWGRILLNAGVVSPRLILSTRPEDGTTFGAERPTDEWGSAGKTLVKPSAGSTWRPVRLGTLTMVVDRARPRRWLIWLVGTCAAGSTGLFIVDYLWSNNVRQRALSPTSKANDSGYPKFVASNAQTTKRIASDLSALVASPPSFGHPDHGLGGTPIELPAGPVDAVVKLSNLVPDDPTIDATDEQLAHSATVHFAVTPRVRLLNG